MATEKRLFDKKEAIKLLRGKCVGKYPSTFAMGLFAAADEIAKLPDVDAVEVVHGRWVPTYHTYYNKDGASEIADELHCSECGIYSRIESNYCPNCGAKTDGDGNG